MVGEGVAGHFLQGLEASGLGSSAPVGHQTAAAQRLCTLSQLVLA